MKMLRPFFFGILAALGALFMEMLAGLFFVKFTPLLALSVLIEEVFIFVFVLKNYREEELASGTNFLFPSGLLGLGFSFMELFLFYFSGEKNILLSHSGTFLGFLGIIAIHIVTATLAGYLIARAKKINFIFAARTLFVTFLIHLGYNILVMHDVLRVVLNWPCKTLF